MPDTVRSGRSVDARTRRGWTVRKLVPGRSASDDDFGGRWGLKPGGVLVAGVGFVLTRFVVLAAIQEQTTPVPFLLSGGLALVFGLAVIVLGIGLTVSTLPRASVNTIAKWCLLGVVGMATITGMGVLEAVLYGRFGAAVDVVTSTQSTNGLIGGAVGGVLIGAYAVKTAEQRRELAIKVDQATLLNRIIRDTVLNKANVIQASVGFIKTDGLDPKNVEAIAGSADRLERAVEEVGFLAKAETRSEHDLHGVDLRDVVERSLRRARGEHPETTFDVRTNAPSPGNVLGNDHLGTVFDRLFARVTDGGGAVSVSILSSDRALSVRVTSDGTSLTQAERDLLVEGELPRYDDPTVGFDLPIVRLLVTQYGGETDVLDGDAAVGVSISLPRYSGPRGEQFGGIHTGIDPWQFWDTALASLVGGVGMGLVLWGLTDTLPAVGGLYGAQSLAIGWILHLFHSVVFGILFVALVEGPLFQGNWTNGRRIALGVGYGLLLWVVAAGVVMPLWLNAVGIESAIPRLTAPSLLGHVTWGALLGGLYSVLADRRRSNAEEPAAGA